MRSWRVWSRSVAPSLSLRNQCGSAFWAVPTLLPHLKRRPPIQPRWTVPNCTAAPRLTLHSAGTAHCLAHDTHCLVETITLMLYILRHSTGWGEMSFSSYNTDSLLCFDRDMCQEISTNWGSQTWQDFDQLCEYNPVETELINCLADVREPCQLGCKDLAYCTNFNNRSDSWYYQGLTDGSFSWWCASLLSSCLYPQGVFYLLMIFWHYIVILVSIGTLIKSVCSHNTRWSELYPRQHRYFGVPKFVLFLSSEAQSDTHQYNLIYFLTSKNKTVQLLSTFTLQLFIQLLSVLTWKLIPLPTGLELETEITVSSAIWFQLISTDFNCCQLEHLSLSVFTFQL